MIEIQYYTNVNVLHGCNTLRDIQL